MMSLKRKSSLMRHRSTKKRDIFQYNCTELELENILSFYFYLSKENIPLLMLLNTNYELKTKEDICKQMRFSLTFQKYLHFTSKWLMYLVEYITRGYILTSRLLERFGGIIQVIEYITSYFSKKPLDLTDIYTKLRYYVPTPVLMSEYSKDVPKQNFFDVALTLFSLSSMSLPSSDIELSHVSAVPIQVVMTTLYMNYKRRLIGDNNSDYWNIQKKYVLFMLFVFIIMNIILPWVRSRVPDGLTYLDKVNQYVEREKEVFDKIDINRVLQRMKDEGEFISLSQYLQEILHSSVPLSIVIKEICTRHIRPEFLVKLPATLFYAPSGKPRVSIYNYANTVDIIKKLGVILYDVSTISF